MHTDFDPVTLRLFLAVCEEGSITRSAERGAIVPSAVSKRMAALESGLGVALLKRGPRGMEPTEAGQAFARQAREVLASMDRMSLTMRDIAKGGVGSVRILASLAALSSQLPADLAHVLQLHPSVNVSLQEAASSDMVRQVKEGSADLAVCWDVADLTGLQAVPYRPDHAGVLVRNSHPLARRKAVAFEETLAFDHVSAMPGSMMEIMLSRHAAVAAKVRSTRLEIESFEGVARMVAANFGIAILPREVLSGWLLDELPIRFIPLSNAWATRRFVVCFRAEPYVSKIAKMIAGGLQVAASKEKV